MVKVRLNEQVYEFENRELAFDWVKQKSPPKTLFSLLEYNADGSLNVMNRFMFTGVRFVEENILK